MQQRDGASRASGKGGSASVPVRHLTSEELLAGAREVVIEHENELYRLRCTSKGKLILTK